MGQKQEKKTLKKKKICNYLMVLLKYLEKHKNSIMVPTYLESNENSAGTDGKCNNSHEGAHDKV